MPEHLRSPHEDVLHGLPDHLELSESVIEVRRRVVLRLGQHIDTLLPTDSCPLQTANYVLQRCEQACESLDILVVNLDFCECVLDTFVEFDDVPPAGLDIFEHSLQSGVSALEVGKRLRSSLGIFGICRKMLSRYVVGARHSLRERFIRVRLHAGFHFEDLGGNTLQFGRKACAAVVCVLDTVGECLVVPVNKCVNSLDLVIKSRSF